MGGPETSRSREETVWGLDWAIKVRGHLMYKCTH